MNDDCGCHHNHMHDHKNVNSCGCHDNNDWDNDCDNNWNSRNDNRSWQNNSNFMSPPQVPGRVHDNDDCDCGCNDQKNQYNKRIHKRIVYESFCW